MKPSEKSTVKVCPKCHCSYTESSALSREDHQTHICPDCGTKEALTALGIDIDEQNKILEIIHRSIQPV